MRRPVKPFVTEYRGGTRRQTAGGPAPKPSLTGIEPDGSTAEQRPSAPWPTDPQEDTYEAALRAADALFSARKPEAPPTSEAPTAPRQATVAATETTAGPTDAPSEASATPQSSTSAGRVLRDLSEPPPSQELLRLEAERAPKRRGRKPGSKNKPKAVPPVAAREDREALSAALDAPAAAHIQVSAHAQLAMRAPRAAARPQAARGPAVAAGHAGDKYAWVRTKLKPGQHWKRRLPKVAW